MCGATSEQKNLEKKQADFYDNAVQESKATFAQQQALLAEMESVYKPILEAGPNQMGFNDEQLERLNAQTVEGTAQNYKAASRVLREKLAADGGGTNPLDSGMDIELQQELAASSAGEQSREQEHVLESGYDIGRHDWETAGNALSIASGQLSPTAYMSAANEAGSAASKTANDIAMADNSWVNAAIGAAGALGGAAITGGMSHGSKP